jgi:hypothetical protein
VVNAQFDYVMAPVSIIVGLALAHILAALGVAVNRLRGHGKPIRLEAVYLLWVAYVLLWIVSFWWWEYKFLELRTTWTFGLYLFVLMYSLLLFFMAVVLVPRGMKDLDDSYAFFMEGRRWFFAVVLVTAAVDFCDALLKGVDWALTPSYLVFLGVFVVAVIVAMRTERRRVQLGIAGLIFFSQVIYSWATLFVLGNW